MTDNFPPASQFNRITRITHIADMITLSRLLRFNYKQILNPLVRGQSRYYYSTCGLYTFAPELVVEATKYGITIDTATNFIYLDKNSDYCQDILIFGEMIDTFSNSSSDYSQLLYSGIYTYMKLSKMFDHCFDRIKLGFAKSFIDYPELYVPCEIMSKLQESNIREFAEKLRELGYNINITSNQTEIAIFIIP